MANAIIEIDLQMPGATGLTVDLYPHTSDTPAASAIALTEEANRDGVYRATTSAGLSGLHQALIYASGSYLGSGYVYMDDTAAVHVVVAAPFVGNVLATGILMSQLAMDANAAALLDLASAIDGKTLRQALRYIAAATAGKVSGAGTDTEKAYGLDGSTERVRYTVDEDGNRTAVEYDPA